MNGHKQPMHMKYRQRMDQHVFRHPAPRRLKHLGVTQQVAVREHGAFGAARGAAGVNHRGQIVRAFVRHHMHVALVRRTVQQGAGAVVIERENVARARLKSQLGHPAKVGRTAHHHSRLGVANEIGHLGLLVRGVEG